VTPSSLVETADTYNPRFIGIFAAVAAGSTATMTRESLLGLVRADTRRIDYLPVPKGSRHIAEDFTIEFLPT
jgi:hypothetical protein